MSYEPNEVEARGLKKEERFLRFFAGDLEAFQESEKEALDEAKRIIDEFETKQLKEEAQEHIKKAQVIESNMKLPIKSKFDIMEVIK